MKKISLRSVSDFLSDNQMKRVLGGYESGHTACDNASVSSCNGYCAQFPKKQTCNKKTVGQFSFCACEST